MSEKYKIHKSMTYEELKREVVGGAELLIGSIIYKFKLEGILNFIMSLTDPILQVVAVVGAIFAFSVASNVVGTITVKVYELIKGALRR